MLHIRKIKAAELLYIFLSTPDEVEKHVEIMQSNSSDKYVYHYNIEILNLFDPELQQIKTKTMIKNSDLNGDLNGELLSDSDLNGELLSNLKKFKV